MKMLRQFCALGLVSFGFPVIAGADTVADFYEDREITLIVSTGPGGGYDLYARTLSEHIVRHIPGEPKIIIQYMPGAGGTKAANYLYNVSPRDGATIALLSQAAPLVQVLDGRGVRYDAAQFSYIGRMVSTNSVVMVWHTAPAQTVEAMKETEIAFATDGRGSQGQYNMALVRSLLGAKLTLVLGYQGSAKILHAMEMGEVHGYAYSWATLRARKKDWIENNKVTLLAEIGLKSSQGLDVPLLMELATDPDHKRAFELVAAPTAIGRSFLTTPDVPEERVKALRQAFDSTMSDPRFVAETKKRNMEIDSMPGTEVQEIVAKIVSTPKEFIEGIRPMLE